MCYFWNVSLRIFIQLLMWYKGILSSLNPCLPYIHLSIAENRIQEIGHYHPLLHINLFACSLLLMADI